MNKTINTIVLFFAFILFTGFNLENASVPKEKILSGGPPKDGIPALMNPRMVPSGQVDFIQPDDYVIGVNMGDQSRAYPIKILNWHEAVNDTIEGVPIVVTF
jgi:hypothetical protein